MSVCATCGASGMRPHTEACAAERGGRSRNQLVKDRRRANHQCLRCGKANSPLRCADCLANISVYQAQKRKDDKHLMAVLVAEVGRLRDELAKAKALPETEASVKVSG